MDIYINNILEKISDGDFEPKRYMIKRLKTINNNIHAVIIDLDDEKSEMLVALSILQDKNKFKLIKKSK
tara:strand:+ start:516 stop:722 length:207 start_codon:yes stop_codon:yes gene_type:complete